MANSDKLRAKELSESELRAYKDELYERAKSGERNFTGLLEIIACRENIIHAIRRVKANSGFKTAGVDNIKGQDILNMESNEFFDMIKEQLENYNPMEVRRVYIPKSNGKTRPLGIPTIVDRIIQTAIANIIEPILEASFYEHSYGFRPMRSVEHALAYISVLHNTSTRYWIVEGDIQGYFDTVIHTTLCDKLFKYGIQDKRVIALIKKVLKAGIQFEKPINDIGTPQGGTLSPLLANLYLTDFDKWVDSQWRDFETKRDYSLRQHKIRALKSTNLKQGYLIRYADDWIIITDSEESAIRWKESAKKYLKEKLGLTLSDEKTKITNVTLDEASFLGYNYKLVKGSNNKFTMRSRPNPDKLQSKMGEVYKALKEVRYAKDKAELIDRINKYNAIIRGLNNYYRITTLYNPTLGHEEWKMRDALMATMRKQHGRRVEYKNCINLSHLKSKDLHGTTIAFEIEDKLIGLEKLGVGKFRRPEIKAQWINPYSAEGRRKYEEITKNRWQQFARNPWLTLGETINFSSLIAKNSREDRIYNLEYFINRPMAYNRDKGKCRICKIELTGNGDVEIHHKDNTLRIEEINKLKNLVTLCPKCHQKLHKQLENLTNIEQDSKTDGVKKIKPISKSRRPDIEVLRKQISEMPMTAVAKIYGVSDNAVRKWAKYYGIYDERLIKLNIKTDG